MNCDEVRDQLAEYLLGTLERSADEQVRRHLRGCAGCRHEMAALAEGVSTFSRAAHQIEPPPELRDAVLAVLAEEWSETAPVRPIRRGVAWLARVAAAAAVVIALAVAGVSTVRAHRFETAASKYDALLGALGGENVRVGTLRPTGSNEVEGSAVLYDSKVGQSWALILVRAPGFTGRATVTLSSGSGRTITMHPLEFAEGGEASSWLVTSSSLKAFRSVTIRDAAGSVLATATVT
ncbi:MAG TPA: zf-HC2 domain-containing protein [Actinomycetota bacterium]|nr:zf-HC2 domain-containing protein [Actinomycetota bacterium]